mmetsp:Transcript_20145/g.28370  ORF Transcript_20145/g.28370 Transcript_20145/m.28370 type:complete len:112 (+) Transcript_20145:3-338(+)
MPTLLGSMPKAGIRFGGNASFRDRVRNKDGTLSVGSTLLAGTLAGITEAIIAVTPIETVKTKCIEMNKPFLSGLRHIIATHGISGLYKGLTPTMIKQGYVCNKLLRAHQCY